MQSGDVFKTYSDISKIKKIMVLIQNLIFLKELRDTLIGINRTIKTKYEKNSINYRRYRTGWCLSK